MDSQNLILAPSESHGTLDGSSMRNGALKPQQVWAVRLRPDQDHRLRDRAMFDLAIDSKLRGCDPVKLTIGDLVDRPETANAGG